LPLVFTIPREIILKSINLFGRFFCVLLLCAAGQASAQTFTVLTSLGSVAPPGGGGNLVWSLVQGLDGNFYGVTNGGGGTCANNPFATCGTVFKVTPAGKLSVIHEFCQNNCTDGGAPFSGLFLSPSGNFYGTTTQDLVNHGGTVYSITPAGRVTTLVSFTGGGGQGTPYGPVVEDNGFFFGITALGGSAQDGTTYRLTPSGTLTTLHTFNGTNGNQAGLIGESLLQAANGDFYGATPFGTESSNTCGTIFKMTPQGTVTTLYSFENTSAQGCEPVDGLVQGSDGDFYGTAVGGGPANDGVIFKLTSTGTLTVLYNFCSQSDCADGSEPNSGLILATDGNFYGTTISGGANNQGTIFQLTPGGTFKVLYSFCSQAGCTDGETAYSALIQATDGNFYGTTSDGGGAGNGGTVYKLSMGLAPFVESLPTSGKTGAQVKILGTDLTGTTGVSFDGVAAIFKVETPTAIVATVPASAKSGKIKVDTPGGVLVSNVAFVVN
jgi:uncharacterized repeat protein (TIGR03803 family)